MSPARSPAITATFEDLYQAYATELADWLHRLRLSSHDAEDAAQEVWLLVAANPERIPTSAPNAQKELRRIATNIARKTRRHFVQNVARRVPVPPDQLSKEVPHVTQFEDASELLDAVDQLEEPLRSTFIGYKFIGFTSSELAAKTGLHEDTILRHVWRASAELQKKLGRKEEKSRGVVIAPADIEIDIVTRAAFCALWTIEGRMPQFGGPKDPPPPPPVLIANASPVVSSARHVSLKLRHAILLVLLLLTSVGTVALIWFWNPVHPGIARTGLHVPQLPDVGEINDVVDAYPAQAPAAPTARPSAPKATPKPPHALDDNAVKELDGPGLSPVGSE